MAETAARRAREGRGLVLYGAAEVEVDNATFERCRDVTLSAYRPGARLSMRRVAVVDTLAVECAETTCSDTPAGIGVGSYREAEVRLEAFVVQGSFLAGVQVVGGQMDLRNGVVSGSPIGANVQSPGYDLSRLTDDVAYRDNGVNLDATSLPVPAPGMVREVVGSDI